MIETPIVLQGAVIGYMRGIVIDHNAGVTRRIITNLAFDLRFTPDERVAIEMASLDDTSASVEAREQAAYIRVALQRADKASWTDLDDPVTRDSVQQFEQYGLIGEGRAAEILDSPVQDAERP